MHICMYVCTHMYDISSHTHICTDTCMLIHTLFRIKPGTQEVLPTKYFHFSLPRAHGTTTPCKSLVRADHRTGFSQWNVSGIDICQLQKADFYSWYLLQCSCFPCTAETKTAQVMAAPCAWVLERCQHESESLGRREVWVRNRLLPFETLRCWGCLCLPQPRLSWPIVLLLLLLLLWPSWYHTSPTSISEEKVEVPRASLPCDPYEGSFYRPGGGIQIAFTIFHLETPDSLNSVPRGERRRGVGKAKSI